MDTQSIVEAPSWPVFLSVGICDTHRDEHEEEKVKDEKGGQIRDARLRQRDRPAGEEGLQQPGHRQHHRQREQLACSARLKRALHQLRHRLLIYRNQSQNTIAVRL